ncbi:MAG: DNA primase noncatalytic subunit PriX [Candidatus Nanoarchaeia archaeon]|nr:DNA primase noncatalytic subunit PriX [Candidatus Jingweiarchaeum tengchongense]
MPQQEAKIKNTVTTGEYIKLLLNEDPNLVGQDYPTQHWKPLSELKTPIRRSLCSNELVFDIDAEAWEPCYQLARNLEDTFASFKIPFFRFTSGNMLHYHVFFDKDTPCPTIIIKDYFLTKRMRLVPVFVVQRELERLLHGLKFHIYYLLVSLTKHVDGAKFDISIMKANKHPIRMEGSLNEKTGYYKSLLLELPKEKPKIKKEEVIFPSEIKYWKIPESLIYYVYDRYIQIEIPKFYSKLKKQIESLKQKRNIVWIENILSKTFSDGRKRLLDLVILPYLINVKGLSVEKGIEMAYKWALKCHEIEPVKIKGKALDTTQLLRYIEMKANYVKEKNLLPLSKKNFEKWFSDCEDILKEVI